jgi:hypothetical protein
MVSRYFYSLFYSHKVHYTALKKIKQGVMSPLRGDFDKHSRSRGLKQGVCLRFAETSINITAHAVKSKE